MVPSNETKSGEDLQDELASDSTDAPAATEEENDRLQVEVEVGSPSACERHITVTVPREEIDRYYANAVDEFVTDAAVPGFRKGRAPRKLVELRFRKDLGDKVKNSLLMDSISQVTEENDLSAISEPDLDPLAIELPDDGPLTYEFNIEVRPQFDLPEWKGLKVERPVRKFTKKEVSEQLERILAERGRLVPHDGPADAGDYIVSGLTFADGENIVAHADEEVIRIRPVLSFHDARLEKFDKLMSGVKAGDTREATLKISAESPSEQLRGNEVKATFEIKEVKRLELPELTPQLLEELGGFASEDELRDVLRTSLERRLEYHQNQRARAQILAALTASADWELPPSLLRRQAERELTRRVLEAQRSGFSDKEIQAQANELRQNTLASTSQALKEHFILERIAEEKGIEDEPGDYDTEIELIAEQSGETPRRVRARLEKNDSMDILRNQIIERKTIELILSHASFTEVPFKPEARAVEALDRAVVKEERSQIPEAHAPEATPLRTPTDHT